MESCRNPNANKLKVGLPHQILQNEKNNFTEDEKKIIGELKQLYLETINLDVKMQREIYNMEKQYEIKHNEIFEKRKKILDDFKKQNHGDSTRNENVSTFWLKVLKASYTEFIGKEDERILSYLSDIRTKHYNDDTVKFVIEFHFDKNDYFKNRVLTKTYILNCVPDADDPLSYDGAEIVRCEGCNIDWKQPHNRDKKDQPTFFDFFSPPNLPDDPEDPNFCDINAILQNDFELGFYLKERVIPKAVIFFTGEIADCQSSDGSETESESDEESDVDGEEESSNGNK
ncbi:nucleosome assembly protein 1-like 1 [Drosophila albomicans]|uniref:Nucleosome assembly protein 1-like 1 n=1 Tax=Drosophila albomicans TaxID=7291 RepID=A0A6P8Z8Q1_DROAB|nr:nucleosome assembly protein 1-like 1 [Drosophila albomicans]